MTKRSRSKWRRDKMVKKSKREENLRVQEERGRVG